jgi:hypothetical protein
MCSQQDSRYQAISTSIASQLERATSNEYYVSGLEINEAIKHPTTDGPMVADPYHTLLDCFIFLARGQFDSALDKPKSVVGIYSIKSGSILWRSRPLPESFSSGAMARVSEVSELNNDGKVEFIICQGREPRGLIEQLWIFNWDGSTGKLITQLNRDGESTLFCRGHYGTSDDDSDGIDEIHVYVENSAGAVVPLTYSWNGSLYGFWGKTSKYLVHKKSP